MIEPSNKTKPQTIPRITMESPSSFYCLQFLLFLLLILQCLLTCNIIFIATYSTINDEELDEIVREAQCRNPNIGIRLAKGFLKDKGHRV